MIVRITFKSKEHNSGKPWVMLFGTSYKPWYEQVREYIGRHFCDHEKGWNTEEMLGNITKVEVSKSAWKGWGGLKWCSHDTFQEELNREGVQEHEPDNPKPRQYSKMKFEEKDPYYVEKHFYGW